MEPPSSPESRDNRIVAVCMMVMIALVALYYWLG
jgi:hypothetical protein